MALTISNANNGAPVTRQKTQRASNVASTSTSTSTSTAKTSKPASSKPRAATKTAQPLRTIKNDEKENINPLTGLDSTAGKKKPKVAFGTSSKANVEPKAKSSSKSNTSLIKTRPQTRSQTPALSGDIFGTSAIQPAGRRRKAAIRDTEDDTMAGRLLAARQDETDADRRARDLTVRPLADLSEAFNLSVESIHPSEIEISVTEIEKEPLTVHDSDHSLAPQDLTAALQLLMASEGQERLPSVVRTRGVKRGRTSESAARSRTVSSSARPTKRARTSGSPDLTPPAVPPNSPARSRSLTLASYDNTTNTEERFDELISSHSLLFVSQTHSILRETSDDEEDLAENTQGSSHFSMISTIGGAVRRVGESFSFDFSFGVL